MFYEKTIQFIQDAINQTEVHSSLHDLAVDLFFMVHADEFLASESYSEGDGKGAKFHLNRMAYDLDKFTTKILSHLEAEEKRQ